MESISCGDHQCSYALDVFGVSVDNTNKRENEHYSLMRDVQDYSDETRGWILF